VNTVGVGVKTVHTIVYHVCGTVRVSPYTRSDPSYCDLTRGDLFQRVSSKKQKQGRPLDTQNSKTKGRLFATELIWVKDSLFRSNLVSLLTPDEHGCLLDTTLPDKYKWLG